MVSAMSLPHFRNSGDAYDGTLKRGVPFSNTEIRSSDSDGEGDVLTAAACETVRPMWFRSLPLDSQWTKTAKMRKAGSEISVYKKFVS